MRLGQFTMTDDVSRSAKRHSVEEGNTNLPAVFAAYPRRGPENLGTAAFFRCAVQERIVPKKLDHDLDRVSSYASHPTGDVDQLLPDLGTDASTGDVGEVYKHREVPLEVGDMLVQVLRA